MYGLGDDIQEYRKEIELLKQKNSAQERVIEAQRILIELQDKQIKLLASTA